MAENAPMVSIIIATFNASATLARCLNSIVNQNTRNWELIVIDGASTDGTVDLIESFSNSIAYWQSQSDSGIYDAWNRGLDKATGKYICFYVHAIDQ